MIANKINIEPNTRVFKYAVPAADLVVIQLHEGAEFLCCGDQGAAVRKVQLALWYRVDTDRPTSTRYIRIAGTGHASAVGDYLDSARLHSDEVVHFFDATRLVKAGVLDASSAVALAADLL